MMGGWLADWASWEDGEADNERRAADDDATGARGLAATASDCSRAGEWLMETLRLVSLRR